MEYAFAAGGLDRCVERRAGHRQLLDAACTAGAHWLLLRADGSAPIAADRRLALVGGDALGEVPDAWVFLGRHEAGDLFAAVLATDAGAGIDGGRWVDLRQAAALLDAVQCGTLAYARALCDWRLRHRHCGSCGTPMRAEQGGHRLACPACGAVAFPRTDPAIIVAVEHGERCLLGRQPGWPAGRYSTLAGFVEPGETLEAAVAREVREEAGITVSTCRYLGSQPWPFPASLMLGFEAQADDDAIILGDELEDARWFDPQQLDAAIAARELRLPPPLSISRWLLERWYRRATGRGLPV